MTTLLTELTWSDILSKMSAPFIDFCKNILLAYKLASSENNLSQMTKQLSHFLLVPQLLLGRPQLLLVIFEDRSTSLRLNTLSKKPIA
jgi:hypothetical protein